MKIKCPDCGSEDFTRSMARPDEQTLGWRLGFVSFLRCQQCGWRGKKPFPSARRLGVISRRVFLAAAGAVVLERIVNLLIRPPAPKPAPRGKK